MKICVLASGSKGNCTYVETEKNRSLIDLGMSNLYIEKKEIGIGFREQFESQMDVILLSLGSSLIAYLITFIFSNSLLQLILGGVMGLLIYILGTYYFKIEERTYINQMLRQIRKSIKC